MSLLLKCAMLSRFLFKKCLGSIVDPIKNAINAIINVIVKLWDNLFKDNIKKPANKKRTINGLKIWLFRILFLFRKFRKFSSGYNFLKKLFTHWSSINPKIEKMVVNKKDLWNSSLILFIIEVKVG